MNKTMNFLPKGTEKPSAGDNKYIKFEQGKNKFRIVSSAITGFVTWKDKQPTRTQVSNPEATEEKEFWAFTVIDRKDNNIKVCEITQKSIMGALYDLVSDDDFGDPKNYDITITREGEGLDTRYTVLPHPPKELSEGEKALVDMVSVKLDALYTGDNPFE